MKRMNGEWKLRGVGYDKELKVEIEHKDRIETKDGKVILVLEKKRPQRLKSAILSGRIQDIGKFKIYAKQIDLKADSKRYWFGKLHRFTTTSTLILLLWMLTWAVVFIQIWNFTKNEKTITHTTMSYSNENFLLFRYSFLYAPVI